MSLVTIDPTVSVYEAQKSVDSDFAYHLRQVRREYVEAVDQLLKVIGNRDAVVSGTDWDALDKVISFYVARWPEDFEAFKNTIPDIRETRRDGGYSESKEIKYVGALPPKLERLIKVCFPYQQFNKDFTYKLVNRVKLFKVGGE